MISDHNDLIMKLLIALTLLIANTTLHARIGDNFADLDQKFQTRYERNFQEVPLPASLADNFLFLKKYQLNNLHLNENKGIWAGTWTIEVLVWRETNIVHGVSYKKVRSPIPPSLIQAIKNANNPLQGGPIESIKPISLEPNNIRPQKVTITTTQLSSLLAAKNEELQKFKKNYLCIGETLQQLERRFEVITLRNNADKSLTEYHFEKFDDTKKENWTVEILLWKSESDPEPVVHQVYYKRITPFTSQELAWQRYINTQGTRWQPDGSDNHFRWKFITTDKMLKAGVRVLKQEAVLHTQALHLHRHPGQLQNRAQDQADKDALPF